MDLCKNCIVRGKQHDCEKTPCNIHGSWFVEQLRAENERFRSAYTEYVYARYQDDGPVGICGQITSETSHWDRLYIFRDYDEAMGFIRKVEDQRDRRNARFTRMWQAGEDFTEVFDCTEHGDE